MVLEVSADTFPPGSTGCNATYITIPKTIAAKNLATNLFVAS